MGPSVVVRGNDDGRTQQGRDRTGALTGEREMPAALPYGHGGRPDEEHGHVDGTHTPGDLGDRADRRVVPADINGGEILARQDEPGDLAGHVTVFVPVAVLRAVYGGHGKDLQGPAAVRPGELVGGPGGEPDGGRAQPLRGHRSGQQHRRGQRERTAAFVEVVRVEVMADQHRVDGADLLLGSRGTGELDQGCLGARVVEGGVGDDPQAADVDHRRRSSEHGDRALLSRGLDAICHENSFWTDQSLDDARHPRFTPSPPQSRST
jgi:hypothetical protein